LYHFAAERFDVEILLGFLAGLFLLLIAHISAIFVLIRIITKSKTAMEFVDSIHTLIKTLAVVVIVVYIVLGPIAYPFTIFATFFCFTLARVHDFEVVFNEVKGYKLP
jgi:hypothetical protein